MFQINILPPLRSNGGSMTSEQKRTYWQNHIEGWQLSGLTQKAYCNQHDLELSTFTYWRAQSARSKPSSKLIPVTVTYTQAITLTLAGGLQLDVPVSLLNQVLPMVLQTLREAS